jgi:hypothetical protein
VSLSVETSPCQPPAPAEVFRLMAIAGYRGTVLDDVDLLGQRVHVAVEIDPAEHARRQSAGCGAVVDHALLDILQSMPVGEALRCQSHQAVVISERSFPAGVLERTGQQMVRLLRRPLRLHGVIGHDRRWKAGLRRMSLFAPLSSRVLRLDCAPRDLQLVALEAAVLDIGLVIATRDERRLLVPPRPVTPRLSAGQWVQLEYLYAQWLRRNGRPGTA